LPCPWPSELASRPRVEDGSGLAIELIQLKNGDADSRDRFNAVQGLFEEITGRRLDVRQQVSGLESQELTITPVVVETQPGGGDVDISLYLAGAGVEESARLAYFLPTITAHYCWTSRQAM